MMTMRRTLIFAALACATALAGCEKNAVQEITGTLPASRIRFFNFGVNAPSVNFYANDVKVSAALSTLGTEATSGVNYGGVSAGGLYSGLEPGQYTFTGRIAATTDKDLAVSTLSTTLETGKAYSYFTSGFYNTTTKTVDAFVVEDPMPGPPIDYNVAHVRFVNAISNSSPMTLYATRTSTPALPEVAVGSAVAYKSAGEFVALPEGQYTLNTRVAGSATNVISRTAVDFVGGRIYTIGARGDMTVVSTTAVNRPVLDNTANR